MWESECEVRTNNYSTGKDRRETGKEEKSEAGKFSGKWQIQWQWQRIIPRHIS